MERESLFSAGDLALILIAVGAEMTAEADALVPQDKWDRVHAEGFAETRRPLHGDAYSALTAKGRARVDAMMQGKHPVTHGRHCLCSACAREDWTRITAPCGMHGADCPAVYAPVEGGYA